jgi:hypothetical protein
MWYILEALSFRLSNITIATAVLSNEPPVSTLSSNGKALQLFRNQAATPTATSLLVHSCNLSEYRDEAIFSVSAGIHTSFDSPTAKKHAFHTSSICAHVRTEYYSLTTSNGLTFATH